MILLLVLLVLVCLWKIHFPGFNENYLSKQQTTAVKGIFTALIFCSHVRGYIFLPDCLQDNLYGMALNYLGQLIVAAFFFYSGYGIWLSFKNKPDYEKTFFKNRFLRTWLHFAIAVAIYILVQAFMPVHYSPAQYLFCWIGWESVGNSSWFIFVILCLYLIALAALFIQKKWKNGGIVMTVFLSAVLWCMLHFIARKPFWWIDTLAVFPLGMIIAEYKEHVDSFFKNQRAVPYLATSGIGLLFLLWHRLFGIDLYGILSCIFCLLLVAVSTWVQIGNPVLKWLGKNTFTVYIIQRLPMIVFSEWGLNQHRYLFVLLALIATGLLAEGLSRLNKAVDSKFM